MGSRSRAAVMPLPVAHWTPRATRWQISPETVRGSALRPLANRGRDERRAFRTQSSAGRSAGPVRWRRRNSADPHRRRPGWTTAFAQNHFRSPPRRTLQITGGHPGRLAQADTSAEGSHRRCRSSSRCQSATTERAYESCSGQVLARERRSSPCPGRSHTVGPRECDSGRRP